MNTTDLQKWLNNHGQKVVIDGEAGPVTRAAIIAAFTNTNASAISDQQIETMAASLGCTAKQIRAVAKVESGGGAYDGQGRPKLLFERHLFHRLTKGRLRITSYSNPAPGGYKEDSWEKLTLAASRDVNAAFSSASWGKFQVLGLHWLELGYHSPIDMAWSTVLSEASHYEMLARFIEHNGLKDELRALSTDPVTCRPFARKYNGPGFAKYSYDIKLSKAMA